MASIFKNHYYWNQGPFQTSLTDQKDKMEAENQNIVLLFGSQLDQRLKDLHKTILGSVSQQQQQLRGMEEHTQSFLASKCDVRREIFTLSNFICLVFYRLTEHNLSEFVRQHKSWKQGSGKWQRHIPQVLQPWRM